MPSTCCGSPPLVSTRAPQWSTCRTAGILVGVGDDGGADLRDLAAKIDLEAYKLWDAWILIFARALGDGGSGAGGQAGRRAFERRTGGAVAAGIRFKQAIDSVAVLVILVLMIWKPGA